MFLSLPFAHTQGFITEVAANLKGFSLPSSSPPAAKQEGKGEEDDDDNYE
jgi:hypothetical protein